MIIGLRRFARRLLPEGLRLCLAVARRRLHDRVSGEAGRLAQRVAGAAEPPFVVVEIVQPIRNTGLVEGKLENIRLGVARLDGVVIAPGEVFSFWALVGEPSMRAGFALGRSIRGGEVGGEIGGGLCQVSGIAYELLLRGGLDPLERHPHWRDLYSEEERFTPLGLDATVVWPYRDVRLANRFDVPLAARFVVEDMTLRATLHAPVALDPVDLAIERIDHPGHRDVLVSRGGVAVSHDCYALAIG